MATALRPCFGERCHERHHVCSCPSCSRSSIAPPRRRQEKCLGTQLAELLPNKSLSSLLTKHSSPLEGSLLATCGWARALGAPWGSRICPQEATSSRTFKFRGLA